MNPADGLRERAHIKRESFRKLAKRIRRKPPQNLDTWFADAHESAFEHINCIDCANCCKTTSPMFFERDIERLAAALRMKPGDFVTQYLFMDTDGIYALRQTPCPFLGPDNYCTVYEARPKACREFPHTTHRRMHQMIDLAVRNAAICPAVYEILSKLEAVQG
jgi:uncharacterized protein